MFLVDTHLPLKDPGLKAALGRSALATLASFAVATLVSVFIMVRFAEVHIAGIFVLLLATSSAAVVEPMIRDGRLSGPTVLLARAQAWS